MAIISTTYTLPLSVTYNGPGTAGWVNPNDILLYDGDFAVSSGISQEMVVGNFNFANPDGTFGIPQGASIQNFTVRVKGYRGSFDTTLQIFAVDDTSGVEVSYPYLPAFQGFDGTNTLWTLDSSLFGTTWTVDQGNNIKLKLIANGELHLDAIDMMVTYDYEDGSDPVDFDEGEEVCCEFVQAQPFQLARAWTDSSLHLFLTSFNYARPTGSPVEPILITDFAGEAVLVADQGKPNEETFIISNAEHDYQGTGLVRLTLDSITDRGLMPKYPYTHDITRCYYHTGSAEVVISNSARFYDRFLKKCQIGALVSPPITVQDEGIDLEEYAEILDFVGSGVTVTNDGINPKKKIVTIPGGSIGDFVESVNDDGEGLVIVDNTDSQNPIVGFDEVALANDEDFINALTSNTDFQDAVNNFISGGGSGVSGSGTKLYISTDSKTFQSGGSYTVPVPAGLLSTNNAVRFRILVDGINLNSGDTITASMSYGGSSIGSATISFVGMGSSITGGAAFLEGYLVATGATNSQRGYMNFISRVNTDNGDLSIQNANGTSAVDSSSSQDLVISFSRTSNGDANAYGIISEKIVSSGDPTGSVISVNERVAIGWSGRDNNGNPVGWGLVPKYAMQDANTVRIYSIQSEPGGDIGANVIEILRNQYGSYCIETSVTITDADLSHPGVATGWYPIVWTKDENYIYGVIGYVRDASGSANDHGYIDVIRLNLDGTGLVVTNIVTTNNTTNGAATFWDLTDPNNKDVRGAVVVGSSLYFLKRNSTNTANEFVEYAISGTSYTLANTYTPSISNQDYLSGCFAISYDSSTSTFYLHSAVVNRLDDSGYVTKAVISGSTLNVSGSTSYKELMYISNSIGEFGQPVGSSGGGNGYRIVDLEFQDSSMDLYVVCITDNYYENTDSVESSAYFLTRLRFPKF